VLEFFNSLMLELKNVNALHNHCVFLVQFAFLYRICIPIFYPLDSHLLAAWENGLELPLNPLGCLQFLDSLCLRRPSVQLLAQLHHLILEQQVR